MAITNEEEIYDPIPVDESELDVVLQLNEDNRIIAMDCAYLETDTIVKLKRKDLPLPYLEFARTMDLYKVINGEFIMSLYEEDPTESEIQNEFNIDVDYRLSCLELGLI